MPGMKRSESEGNEQRQQDKRAAQPEEVGVGPRHDGQVLGLDRPLTRPERLSWH